MSNEQWVMLNIIRFEAMLYNKAYKLGNKAPVLVSKQHVCLVVKII